MTRIRIWAGLIGAFLLAAHLCMAQRSRNSLNSEGASRRPRNSNYGEGWVPNSESIRTAREVPASSDETPTWTNAPALSKDVFTFARVRYTRLPRSANAWWRAGYWYSDFPSSDLNLSYRLQQLTSIKVDPNGRVLDIEDPDLFSYPWIYMAEPGQIVLEDEEVPILKRYLLGGGFLMADDFWGDPQWANFEREIKRVFPDRAFVELPMDHKLFHCVYDLKGPKNKLQVPNAETGRQAERSGVTWEYKPREGDTQEVHIKAILDDKQRIMVLACHNTDYGDGWERESEDDYFFREFSQKTAYPLAINIIFYAMTH